MAAKKEGWLSSLLRPRGSSLEAKLNITHGSRGETLNAKSVIPLLRKSESIAQRVRTLQELTKLYEKYAFLHTIEVWFSVKDLLYVGAQRNARVAVLNFMATSGANVDDKDFNMLLLEYFSTLRHYDVWEDTKYMYRALRTITKDGKEISTLGGNVLGLLSLWINRAMAQLTHCLDAKASETPSQKDLNTEIDDSVALIRDLFNLVADTLKFNFNIFERDTVASVIQLQLDCYYIGITAVQHACLHVLDTIIRFGSVPIDALPKALSTLALAICQNSQFEPEQTSDSIQFIRPRSMLQLLIKSHLANSCLRHLCHVLQSSASSEQIAPRWVVAGSIRLLSVMAGEDLRTDTRDEGGPPSYRIPLYLLINVVEPVLASDDVVISAEVFRHLHWILRHRISEITPLLWDAMLSMAEKGASVVVSKGISMNKVETVKSFDPDCLGIAHALTGQNSQCVIKNAATAPETQEDEERLRQQYGGFLLNLVNLQNEDAYTATRERFVTILHKLRSQLPERLVDTLLSYYITQVDKLAEDISVGNDVGNEEDDPSSEESLVVLRDIVNTFYLRINISKKIRLKALSIVQSVYQNIYDTPSSAFVADVLAPVFKTLEQEEIAEVATATIDFLVRLLLDDQLASHAPFLRILFSSAKCTCSPREAKSSTVSASAPSSPTARATIPHAPYTPNPANTKLGSRSAPKLCCVSEAADGLCLLFKKNLETASISVTRDLMLRMLDIAKTPATHVFGRLVILKCLLSLRCRSDHRLWLEPDPDTMIPAGFERKAMSRQNSVGSNKSQQSDGLQRSSSLRQSARSDASNQPRSTVNERSASQDTLFTPAEPSPTMDSQKAAFPEPRPRPSPFAYSFIETVGDAEDPISKRSPQSGALPMESYLEAVRIIIESDTNWEVVSFVLFRLPVQLTVKHLFCGATNGILALRKVSCELVRTDRQFLHVVNLPSNMKRTETSLLIYNMLTVLISYRRIFKRPEQDDLVAAFVNGASKISPSTRTCVNAMNICAYEMPMSISNFLREILLKFSQLISHTSVSVHILEFLHTLARLPAILRSQTDEVYRRVFAIALSYIHHSNNQQEASSSNHSTPATSPNPSTGHLPHSSTATNLQSNRPSAAFVQYVFITAYSVIYAWFIAIPVQDRRRYIPYIVRELLNANQKSGLDEQSLTCLDFLSRCTYASFSLRPEENPMSKKLMESEEPGKIVSRSWIYGATVLTIKTRKNTGWAEISIRRASGTVSLLTKVQNPLSFDFDYDTLVGLLLMHNDAMDMEQTAIAVSEHHHSGSEGQALGIQMNVESEDQTDSRQQGDSGKDTDVGVDEAVQQRGANLKPVQGRSRSQSTSATLLSRSKTLKTQAFEHYIYLTKERQLVQNGSDISEESGRISGGASPLPEGRSAEQKSIFDDLLKTPALDATDSLRTTKLEVHHDPGFLRLQMANYPDLINTQALPKLLPQDDAQTTRSLEMLDKIPVVDFHKIGVIYVGKGQKTEQSILQNTCGSPEYSYFLSQLGSIMPLKNSKENTGGLDTKYGGDGEYTYQWRDEITHIVYHVATMMPTDLENDPHCINKKKHIGNDFVRIIYNESGEAYPFDTMPGHFNYINILISPHSEESTRSIVRDHQSVFSVATGTDRSFFKVVMQRRPGMPEIGPVSDFKMVSSKTLPIFVRFLALHANVFSQVFLANGEGYRQEYVSNWKGRLREIRALHAKAINPSGAAANAESSQMWTDDGRWIIPQAKSGNSGNNVIEPAIDFTRYV